MIENIIVTCILDPSVINAAATMLEAKGFVCDQILMNDDTYNLTVKTWGEDDQSFLETDPIDLKPSSNLYIHTSESISPKSLYLFSELFLETGDMNAIAKIIIEED